MRIRIAAVLVLTIMTAARAAEPWAASTQPALTPLPDAVLRIWPSDPPATQAYDPDDTLIPRGKTGGTWYMAKNLKTASLAVYLPAKSTPSAAVVICPGGGYTFESVTDEGIRIAKKFNDNGVVAFVLKYRLPDGHAPADGQLPVPQQDVLRAIQFVRAQAEKFHVDPKRVGVIGFSAGGHVAATAATLYDRAGTFADKAGHDAASTLSARPDFAVLIYPVISMDRAVAHGGSRKNLLGATPDAALVDTYSADLHVTPQTPPLFIVHAKDDTIVPIANAERMDAAAAKAGVPHEYLAFEKGGHGFNLGSNEKTRTWFAKCVTWMRSRQMLAE